jgi:hypothetical protein
VWVVKSLIRVVSAIRVDACVWEGEEYGSYCSFGERHSMIEEIQTSVIVRPRRTLILFKIFFISVFKSTAPPKKP